MKTILGALLAASLATPATARTLTFTAALDGASPTAATGSAATGRARVRVDTARKRISVDLAVEGITVDDLWDTLVARPIGPVHFHQYGDHLHQGQDAVLVYPLPYGPTYRATAHGFHVALHDADYAAGAALLGSTASFDEFVAAMAAGRIVLNVHTDRFHDGEIAGPVEPR